MKMFKYSSFIILFSCAISISANAQVDTIRLKDKRLNTSVLKPGLNQYLVYFQDPKKKTTLRFSLWLRNIQLQDRNGEKVFTIIQHWFGSDSASYRNVYSINNASDFAPIYHSETVGAKTKAYNWGVDKMTGADSVAQNLQKSFSLDFKLPNFNWNLDIETFEMLPLAEGKIFAINFYDAGLDPPAYVNYKVVGSEVIQTISNEKADCWKLTTEGNYKGTHYSETYWISKKNHEFLKEEDSFSGMYRYKIKMPANAPDIMERIAK